MLYMDRPAQAEIAKLIAHRGGPAVSLYLRTTPVIQDAQADRIEVKNLLKSALTQIEESGAPKRDAEATRVARNYDVTDEIARRAWLTGARVAAARRADVPEGGALAAILRYAF